MRRSERRRSVVVAAPVAVVADQGRYAAFMRITQPLFCSLTAVILCDCATRPGIVISSRLMESLPDETPWHRFVDVGPNSRVKFEFEKTKKGNGVLHFPGGGVRIYDAYDDGRIFDPFALDTRLIDLNGDGYLDLEVSGMGVQFDEKGDTELERRRVQATFLFVPATKTFTNIVSDPWIYTE